MWQFREEEAAWGARDSHTLKRHEREIEKKKHFRGGEERKGKKELMDVSQMSIIPAHLLLPLRISVNKVIVRKGTQHTEDNPFKLDSSLNMSKYNSYYC